MLWHFILVYSTNYNWWHIGLVTRTDLLIAKQVDYRKNLFIMNSFDISLFVYAIDSMVQFILYC